MRKLIAAALALCLALSLCACGGKTEDTVSAPAAAGTAFDALEPVELVAADSTSKGAAGQLFMEYVIGRIETLSGGKLTVDYHPNSDLGGDADILRQMQSLRR